MKRARLIRLLLPVLGIVILMGCNKGTGVFESSEAFVNKALLTTNGIVATDLKQIIDTAETYLLLDVREPNEHHPGYIPGSLNIPRGVIEFKMGNADFWESKYLYEPLKEDLIVVYCKKGHRGILVAETLTMMGFTNILYLEGGFKAWEMAYPNDYDHDEIQHGAAEEEVGGC